jgi:large subunit ribosomal protein L6
MSRIGNAPIEIPDKVDVAVDGRTITVKGPKGELSRTLHDAVEVTVDDGQVVVARASDERDVKALHGLMRALINNMVVGVTEGFSKELSIVGVGYRAAKKGSELELQVGFSHPVLMDDVDGVTVEVPEPTKIIVSGIDKESVGQVAANIRDVKPPEPYKGKGIRYVDEHVVRKAGKAGVR